MNTKECIRKLRQSARKRSIYFDVKRYGKGSHRTIYLGDRKTRIPWTTNDLTVGTIRGVLKQLGVDDLFLT